MGKEIIRSKSQGIIPFILASIVGFVGFIWRLNVTYIKYEYPEDGTFSDAILSTLFPRFCFWDFEDEPELEGWAVLVWICLFIMVISIIMCLLCWHSYIIVSENGVSGKTKFGRFVELPINQLSAIGLGWGQRITVSTSSGSISFWRIANRDEIYEVLSRLLVEIQTEKTVLESATKPVITNPSSNADELKKYKELFDTGVITQEEFESKKKQLLGL